MLLAGCGGLSDKIGGGSSASAGLYRGSLTRGTTTLSISIDASGNARAVITDDGATLPTFTGTGTVSTTNGTATVNVPLTGSDGSSATLTGTFGASAGSETLTVNIAGGIGANGLVLSQIDPKTLYPGTWSGSMTYAYSTGAGTQKSTANVTYTIAADGATLTGSGMVIDPNGVQANLSISGSVDPSGQYTETTTYTYANQTPQQTVSYTGYLNVDFSTGNSMVGSQKGTWTSGVNESDILSLTKSASGSAPRVRK